MSQLPRRSRVRYAAPTAPPHGRSRGRLERRRVMVAPFPPVPDLPSASAARGVAMAIPVALSLWALLALAALAVL